MKTQRLRLHFFLLVYIVAIIAGCASTKNTTGVSEDKNPEVVDIGYGLALENDIAQSKETIKPNEKAPSNLTLADMLRRASGVTVTGNGNNVKIIVRGVSTFGGASDPLYVLNGVSVGNNYAMVANSINTNEITSIRVLKGAEAAIYGTQGGNGVILIRTITTQ